MSFLQSPVEAFQVTADGLINERPGTVIGPYNLLEQIGEGRSGAVFLAEQTQPVRRTVAQKVVKPGMDTHSLRGPLANAAQTDFHRTNWRQGGPRSAAGRQDRSSGRDAHNANGIAAVIWLASPPVSSAEQGKEPACPARAVMAALTTEAVWLQDVWQSRLVRLRDVDRVEISPDGIELARHAQATLRQPDQRLLPTQFPP